MDRLLRNLTTKIHNTVRSPISSSNGSWFLKAYYNQKTGPVTEKEIITVLRKQFPKATLIGVEDTSSGCGAMFNVVVETSEFKGLSIIKQHKLIYHVLKDQIKSIHGIHLETHIPK
ncbi:hypothetical protein NQ317_007108 [Molorchus minor]|uniref:BolA-like protein 3 n=1 Tax=Molorchus minor TaxID=1323400 RepID=A0ABQ9JYW7_9CUCU|nr:hypothetical protein NQ317_007108 [Molorchus minor]